MADFLDHAITVRDVLYVCGPLFVLVVACVGWFAYITHPPVMERKRQKQLQLALAAERTKPGQHLRNPAYGIPGPGVKKPQPTENHRNPAYGLKPKS